MQKIYHLKWRSMVRTRPRCQRFIPCLDLESSHDQSFIHTKMGPLGLMISGSYFLHLAFFHLCAPFANLLEQIRETWMDTQNHHLVWTIPSAQAHTMSMSHGPSKPNSQNDIATILYKWGTGGTKWELTLNFLMRCHSGLCSVRSLEWWGWLRPFGDSCLQKSSVNNKTTTAS